MRVAHDAEPQCGAWQPWLRLKVSEHALSDVVRCLCACTGYDGPIPSRLTRMRQVGDKLHAATG